MSRHIFVVAAMSATMAFALIGAGDYMNEPEPDYENIPVAMPAVTIPQPALGKAHTPIMRAASLASYPHTFYALPATLDADELPEDAAMVDGIGAIPEGLDGDCIYVFDTMGVNVTIGGVNIADSPGVNVLAANVGPNNANAANVAVGNANAAEVAQGNVKVIKISVMNIATPSVYSAESRINTWIEFREKTLPMFKDQRMAAYDKGLSPFNTAMQEWLRIYKEYANVQIAHVPMPNGIRMIAELRCPKDANESAILQSNLAFYAAQGYTSALLAIYGDETSAELRSTLAYIKAAGMKLWFAFSGRESLHDTLFTAPQEIERCFSIVAPKAEGMLLGWRRTSVHLFLMDLEYANFLMAIARKYNASLPILGEGYYGQTANSDHKTNHLTYNMPENVSGCEIIGAGYANVNAAMALNGLFCAVKAMPRVAVVLGDRPYYATRNGNGRSFAENLAIKQRIEQRFIAAGCNGTITLHGDGSDGIYDKSVSDNLSKCLATGDFNNK